MVIGSLLSTGKKAKRDRASGITKASVKYILIYRCYMKSDLEAGVNSEVKILCLYIISSY